MLKLDLDVDAPDRVAPVLRAAAQAYLESESELAAAWGDKGAGRAWGKIARELEKTADRIERLVP